MNLWLCWNCKIGRRDQDDFKAEVCPSCETKLFPVPLEFQVSAWKNVRAVAMNRPAISS